MAARWIALGVLMSLMSISPAFAQEFALYESKQDLFSVNFPGEPVITTIPWETEYGAQLMGRVYTVIRPGPRTYSVTVVDYNPVKDILTAKANACPDQRDERCTGHTSYSGAGYWKNDVRGAMIYAGFKLMKRPDITLTHYNWNYLGGGSMEVNELQLVNNRDKARTFATLYMHHNVLYILEESVPANYPPPGLFVQSVTLSHADGSRGGHDGVYINSANIEANEKPARRTEAQGGQPPAAQPPGGAQGQPAGTAPRGNNP